MVTKKAKAKTRGGRRGLPTLTISCREKWCRNPSEIFRTLDGDPGAFRGPSVPVCNRCGILRAVDVPATRSDVRRPEKIEIRSDILERLIHARPNSSHDRPSCLTAARIVPSFKSSLPQSGTTVRPPFDGLSHFLCEPSPVLGTSRHPRLDSFLATSRYLMARR
jgi:hypothetical protein